MMSEEARLTLENAGTINGMGNKIPAKHMMSLQEINEYNDVGGVIEARNRAREENTPEHLKYNKNK